MQLGRRAATSWSGVLHTVLFLFSSLCTAHALAADAAAEAVGEVVFVQGLATAQRAGAAPRFLQKGEPLYEGEVLTTGSQGYTIISFKDGTKFTLRPSTTFTVEQYRSTTDSESAAFRLLKGGLRAISGGIAKRGPAAMQVNTNSATVGIRGTSFDMRICETECAEEQSRAGSRVPTSREDPVVARVAVLNGTARATAPGGQTRPLSQGSALFNGDSVRTDKASHAVLAFRDRSKVTVIADSEFKLDDVRFSGAKSENGNFAVRVLRGGVRALTGLLARENPKAVNFGITTAVIGLRGTGFDAHMGEHCAAPAPCAEAAFDSTWQRETELRAGDRAQPVLENQTAVFVPSTGLLALVDQPPPFPDPNAPRPDTVEVDFDRLFAILQLETPRAGLHLGMRGEGETELRGSEGFIYLAGTEAGWLPEGSGVPVRVTPNWATIMNSSLPAPESFDERSTRVLELLNPGDLICEIR